MKIKSYLKKHKILLFIILVATFLRFFQLATLPPSLTWDEVAWGYNAYSLGLDGKDEFGKFLPYDYLESFGDFKPPVYAYLDILPIKIFGLTEFAVRFPSALFGVLTVFLTYLLVKRIFYKSKNKELYGLLTAGLLAISPWHILLSRAAFEANVATFFLVFGVYAFLRAIQDKSKFLILSTISFALSIYTFNTSRIVAPLLVLLLIIAFRKKLLVLKKISIAALLAGLLIVIPLTSFLLSPQAKLRYQEVNIFSNLDLVKTSNQEITNDHNAWWSKIIHNRRIIYAREYMKHYFDNLSLNFLFVKGDENPKFSTQDIGQMYLWELPFLIIGTLFLFRFREGNWFIVPIWLLLAIIPAATARETPHALRIETTLPTFQIIVAYGIINTYLLLKKYRKTFTISLSLIAALFFIYFLHVYFVLYPEEFSVNWQYGYKESIAYAKSVQNQYDHIVVENSLGRPYIYYLFYQKISPVDFRRSATIKRDAFGFVSVEGFSKYEFPEMIQIDPNSKKTLYILYKGNNSLANKKPIKTFYFLDGSPVFNAYAF
jgi:4-amino-4-deoxy-L-arabinose transferase-like glycosyltransferase